MRGALELSTSPSSPWLMWSVGGVGRPRASHTSPLASNLTDAGSRSSVGRDLLLMFLPGSASLYYGDEIDVSVPSHLQSLDWAGIMAWSGSNEAGFSSHPPWLALGGLHKSYNVEALRLSSIASVSALAAHKRTEPPLYINGLFNFEGDYHPTHASNLKVRYVDDDLLILERFYPRRRQYLVVANLGHNAVTRDLSHYYYGGEVVASSHNNSGYIEFRNLQLEPSEVLVCVLDK
ncbi:uncharacterized protein LOC108676237 [Hyalella azteca]|uniref:Uncharacterized protein LOC108676237 n=1 Tax=Hyalella azteca TaxID=294128 RepID=A0A8B7P188_HYAAZ|nr:uncharacterized protein LOC108676237 [Hyalella azteca]